jgi:S-DNA-T family DNA segregation ATPase FtsK/SpoIIIE
LRKPGVRATRREIGGVLLAAVALVAYFMLTGLTGGIVGRMLAENLRAGFGLMAWWWPTLVGTAGVLLLFDRWGWGGPRRQSALLAASLLVEALFGLMGVGGSVGAAMGGAVARLIGSLGAAVLLMALLAAALSVLTGMSLAEGARRGGQTVVGGAGTVGRGGATYARRLRDWVAPVEEEEPPGTPTTSMDDSEDIPLFVRSRPDNASAPPPPDPPEEAAPRRDPPAPKPKPVVRHGAYPFPPLELLYPPDQRRGVRGRSAAERGQILVDTLKQFGVAVRLADVSQGPAVTRFEIVPPPGVKVSKIVNLSDDIALSLAATGVRIEAPIPGKSAIGIEIANEEVAVVRLREVLESRAFQDSASALTVGLGKDISGQPVVAALDQMPHLLVAGATGSGKSVLMNTLILSLVYKSGPERLRLILIDPKVVELSMYNRLPHLVDGVVTDPKRASRALRWAVVEMERRYRLFAASGARDIGRYNLTADEPLPYYVIVIDELADLMMVAPVEVEQSIARLAQMARAAGLHLVVATQRPSVDVITGTIKANIPSRIAFAVSSQVDSRTILDMAGAERLLGRGDMLFHPVGAAKPQRVQGAFVQEAEIERVMTVLADVPRPEAGATIMAGDGEDEAPADQDDEDSRFVEALRVVVESRQASASLLQRRMRVGYTRAARLVDRMEELGYVSPADGARGREVRLSPEEFHRRYAHAHDAADVE